LITMPHIPQMPSRQSWSNAIGSSLRASSCWLSTSSISRNDMSGLTSVIAYRTKPPGSPDPRCRQMWSVRCITCSSVARGGPSRTRGAPCEAPAPCPHLRTPRPPRSQSAHRRASPRPPASGTPRGSGSRTTPRAARRRDTSARRTRGSRPRVLQPGGVPSHHALVPHQTTELAVEGVDRLPTARAKEATDPLVHLTLNLAECRMLGVDLGGLRLGEVVADRVWQDEVAVGESLHQRARSQPVRAVVGEVRLADGVQAVDGRHQVVVHPQTTHRVVRGGVDPHRYLERVLPRNALVHLEQVAVPLGDHLTAEARDGVAEVQINAVPSRAHAVPFVAHFLGTPGRHVPGREVPVARVQPLEIVVPLLLGNLVGRSGIALPLRYPDA